MSLFGARRVVMVAADLDPFNLFSNESTSNWLEDDVQDVLFLEKIGNSISDSDCLNIKVPVMTSEVTELEHAFGHATISYSDGSLYRGPLCYGYPHGFGYYAHPNGSVYVGNFWYGKKDGSAEWKEPNGNIFEGVFQDDTRLDGKQKNKDGTVYVGKWKNNLPEDIKGQKWKRDEWYYVGEFKEGMPNGFGKICWKGGSCYQGKFKNGMMHGYGIYESLRRYYKGHWLAGLRDGFGVEVTGTEKYEGYWMNNLREGSGTLSMPDGTSLSGVWDKGTRIGTIKH